MALPRNLAIYELRAKRGRKHVLMARFVAHESWSYESPIHQKIHGPVRWYRRRRGERFKPITDWLAYW